MYGHTFKHTEDDERYPTLGAKGAMGMPLGGGE